MQPRQCSLVRAYSERQLGIHEHGDHAQDGGVGPNILFTDLTPALEKTRLLAYKNTAVSYVNGNHVHHKILPYSGSNTVFPTSSLSLSLMHCPLPQSGSAPYVMIDGSFGGSESTKLKRRIFRTQATASSSDYNPPTITVVTAEKRRSTSPFDRIRINVSGQHYEIQLGALERHPDTLLGDRVKRHQFFDRTKNELFFDRHRPSFEAIFSYYQCGGRLRRPHHVPDDVFLDELLFYQLEDVVVEEYKRSEGYTFETVDLPTNLCMRKVWMLFEYPETSRLAFYIAIMSVIMTLVSIVLFCVETLPMFAMTHCEKDAAPNFLDKFFIIETICTALFTVEAIVRFIACPSKLRFWKDFKNIVDVTAIVPYYVTLFNVLSTMSCEGAKSSASLAFLRVIRLIRIFKLTKHSVGLQVLILTFQASLEGLGLFLVALCVCLLVFSSAVYYAELGNDKTQIESIPDAFWWAIITMTTVGYGDKVPVGIPGKLVGAACAITGVLTLAIPVPIITGHFNRFYAHKTGRGRHI